MKKHLFLLGSSMATSLVTANTLLVISCQKKTSVQVNENTSEQVELKIAARLKDEIRNIIDDVIANPMTESVDWIIDLNDRTLNNNQNTINFLNQTVERVKKEDGENGQVALIQLLPTLDANLINKIKAKFAELKTVIIERINKIEDLNISNFNFEPNLASIEPALTTLNGAQVMYFIKKLDKKPTGYALTAKDNIEENFDKVQIDLFKVKTDISYTFRFGDVKDNDSYNNAELILSGDTEIYKKVNRYTQQTVRDIFTKSDEVKDVLIYSSDNNGDNSPVKEIQKYEYIGKQMDWDFSKQSVKDEIALMQYENLNKLKEAKGNSTIIELVKEMKFNLDYFDFEIDPSRYMKFDNSSIDLRSSAKENCILICADHGKGLYHAENSKKAIKEITKQFFSDNDESKLRKWNGGKINHKFIAQAKKDGEAENPIIDLSKYYGLGSEKETNDMLVGYGTTTIKNASYAGIPLPKMIVNTNITAKFDPGMDVLYDDFRKYVEAIIKVIRNEETKTEGEDHGLWVSYDAAKQTYRIRWGFGNQDEWNIIQNEVTKPDGDKTITFNWIMENALLKKRVAKNPSIYKFPKNETVLDTAKTFLKSANEITYKLSGFFERKNNQYADLHVINNENVEDYEVVAKVYVKYGPFIAYLDGDDGVVWADGFRHIFPDWGL